MRILLDTNLWVAALISASMRNRIERIIADDRLDILADAELMAELEEVCARPKFAHLLSPAQIADFLQILHDRLTFIETKSQVQVCRDPDDDFLFAICLDGQAEYLLTGDNDLLALRAFEKTRILTITEFEQIL
ncbi:MAG: putative toxin-antitoxin system toxin component, PIN family [Haliscomenobacteraceae bacterium CHB4]|nr:hypothetical protein [Saprospiraceae bacterium]MCE7924305.1 putative toxin-antitoxin system toxin component, PIN family [Haliscomenobacteraceae bacterium CHB4]